MKITDVRLRTVKSDNELKLKAYADITFDESFVIHGLKTVSYTHLTLPTTPYV